MESAVESAVETSVESVVESVVESACGMRWGRCYGDLGPFQQPARDCFSKEYLRCSGSFG